VDLRFLFRALALLGFPPAFTDMVRLLFLNAVARVSVNGKATGTFPIQQDVRQGCPLAPYLFLIIGEILNLCQTRSWSGAYSRYSSSRRSRAADYCSIRRRYITPHCSRGGSGARNEGHSSTVLYNVRASH
jgi:hypothetical protein